MKTILGSLQEMHALATSFAGQLKQGQIIGLCGKVGTGKTSFVQAVAKALGINKDVTSPTYTYLKSYALQRKDIRTLYHCDVYRLDPRDRYALDSIGITDAMADKKGVTFIEWADTRQELLRQCDVILFFTHEQKNKRSVTHNGLLSKCAFVTKAHFAAQPIKN